MSKSGNYEVQVNTATMRDCADQLGVISRRVADLQERLAALSSAAGMPVPGADVLDVGNKKICQCIGYLKDTASDFETVERSIASRL